VRRLSIAHCVRERDSFVMPNALVRHNKARSCWVTLLMPNALVTQQLLAIAYTLRPFAACAKLLYVLGVEAVVYLGRRPVPSGSGG